MNKIEDMSLMQIAQTLSACRVALDARRGEESAIISDLNSADINIHAAIKDIKKHLAEKNGSEPTPNKSAWYNRDPDGPINL